MRKFKDYLHLVKKTRKDNKSIEGVDENWNRNEPSYDERQKDKQAADRLRNSHYRAGPIF